MAKKVTNIQVKDTLIRTMQQNGMDYVCITDIARQKNAEEPKDVVKNWMRLKNTIEYMGLWEKLNNPQFKGVGFDPLFQEAGSNAFTLSPTKWMEQTNAMTEYIFYTTEGFTQAPDGEDIENCQLLGRAYGKDKHDALSNLLNENPWIKERGFEPDEAICKELASTANAEAKLSFLTNLLDKRQLAELPPLRRTPPPHRRPPHH